MLSPPLLRALVGDPELEALFSDEVDLAAMLRVEAAIAEAQAEAGLIPGSAAARIAVACLNFQPDNAKLAAGLARDGVVVPELVMQLRQAVGGTDADCVHFSLTSQDVIDTSLVLRLADVVRVLDARLAALLDALSELRTSQGSVRLMAHTRMQAALPFTAADKIDTWLLPIERHRLRLAELVPRLLVIQLGGPVGTRADMQGRGNAVAAAAAERLGLDDAPPWHAARDGIAEFAGFLSLVSGSLGKIGQDLAIMAQNKVGAVKISGGGGSSAMAHKSNPVAAEILVALARMNAGLLGTLHQGLVHENERSGAAWTLEWLVLPQMVVATGAGLRHGLALCGRIEFLPLRDA